MSIRGGRNPYRTTGSFKRLLYDAHFTAEEVPYYLDLMKELEERDGPPPRGLEHYP